MPSTAPRLPLIDALRGFAVAQMLVYHFIYDLDYFGWLHLQMLSDPRWIAWRSAIVTQFLLLVGVGLVLRTSFKPALADFWKRWAEVAAAALLVSIGSYFVFGPRFIWFGILHFIAAALLIARPLVRFGAWNIALGAVAGIIGLACANDAFNDAPLSVIGLVTAKPRTEDYVPLLPWIGVVLIGAGLASMWKQRNWAITSSLQRLNSAPSRPLVFLGTWALTIYLVHQPLFMALLSLARRAGL
ncbi:MAG: heparan-alpha-glucosaminide N-acetyltransferase [Burkholderiaceae bacterium]